MLGLLVWEREQLLVVLVLCLLGLGPWRGSVIVDVVRESKGGERKDEVQCLDEDLSSKGRSVSAMMKLALRL